MQYPASEEIPIKSQFDSSTLLLLPAWYSWVDLVIVFKRVQYFSQER
jgi:hypothetical protein